MSAYLWFLLGTAAFVAVVYFAQETETETVGRAALNTLGVLAAIGFLTVVGGALWTIVL